MICMNMGIGLVAQIPDQPLSVSSNCYYDYTQAPTLLSSELEDVRDELTNPTNMTNTGIGDGLPLDNFVSQTESLARQTEIALSFFTGGYVITTIAQFTLGCTVTCDQALVNGKCEINNGSNFVYSPNPAIPMWDTISDTLQIIVFVALLLAIISLVLKWQGLSPYN